jgi:hypothetical protein
LEFPVSSYTSRSILSECITQAWATVKGENPFGEVEAGIVRITGKVAELNSDLELSQASFIRSQRPWIMKLKGGHPWLFNLDWNPLEETVSQEKLKMVLLGSGIDFRRRRAYFGILIHETGTPPGTFYRIGSFMSHDTARHPRNSARQFFDRCETQTVDIV